MRLSMSIKSTIARWIRQTVASRFSQERWKDDSQNGPGSEHILSLAITSDQFQAIRRVLEDLEDFAILADVLKIIAASEDITSLTCACDTVNYHFSVFAAIGSLEDLFFSMLQQYKDVSKNTSAEQTLIESLIDLGNRIPNTTQEVHHLRQQIHMHRQKAAAAACSPISDHMTETLHSAEPDFSDELDQVLASGTSMDKHNLTQLFERIVNRGEESWKDSKQPIFLLPELLSRLRPFDPGSFEALMVSWIDGVLRSGKQYEIPKILPTFVSSGCITLDKVLSVAHDMLQDRSIADHHTMIAMDMLELLTMSQMHHLSSLTSKGYRFCLQHVRILQRNPAVTLPFLQFTIEALAACHTELRIRAQALILNDGVQDLIKILAVRDPEALQNIGFSAGAATLLDQLIPSQVQQKLGVHDNRSEILHLLSLVNYYNMPLCQLRLRILLSMGNEAAGKVAATLSSILGSDIEYVPSGLTPELVSGLPSEHGDGIRQCLERDILSSISRGQEVGTIDSGVLIDRMLSVIEAIGTDYASQTSYSLISQIEEKISQAVSLYSPPAMLPKDHYSRSPSEERGGLRRTINNLDILLRLLGVHQSTIRRPGFPQSTLIQLHISLAFLVINRALDASPSLKARSYDTLLVLSDSLSEDTRNNCIRTLLEHKIRDPRVCFVFGYSEPIEEVQVVSDDTTTTTKTKAAAQARPSTSQATQMTQPYSIRRWEMMQDATPLIGNNDTSLSLTLFGARKSVL